MLTNEQRDEVVSELASRPGHEKVRALTHRLLVDDLGADSRDIDFEKSVPEARGRIDALLGRTVFEFKSDLRRELLRGRRVVLLAAIAESAAWARLDWNWAGIPLPRPGGRRRLYGTRLVEICSMLPNRWSDFGDRIADVNANQRVAQPTGFVPRFDLLEQSGRTGSAANNRCDHCARNPRNRRHRVDMEPRQA